MTTLQTLKGFRDFLPSEKRRRDWVADRLRQNFARFGFQPLETPTLEYRETIMGKYGAEADKLVYQFVDNGDRAVAMRYDQTVPTARVVAQYRNELPFPFRRYQMQNVFRAEKPQAGRFREFAQCDIDIFGSTFPLADAEVLACTYAGYQALGFTDIELRFNDRQLLIATIAPFSGAVSTMSIIQTIDKLDKIGDEGVVTELVKKGMAPDAAEAVLGALKTAKPSAALQAIVQLAVVLGVPEVALVFTPELARGLDYYTGMIFEVVSPSYGSGSLGGGGRYDNLIEQLSGQSVPAVGMAFGFDRTVEAADALGLIPTSENAVEYVVTVFSAEMAEVSGVITARLRQRGANVELYPAAEKLSKQLKYADRIGARKAVIVGPDEAARGYMIVRDLVTGEQSEQPLV